MRHSKVMTDERRFEVLTTDATLNTESPHKNCFKLFVETVTKAESDFCIQMKTDVVDWTILLQKHLETYIDIHFRIGNFQIDMEKNKRSENIWTNSFNHSPNSNSCSITVCIGLLDLAVLRKWNNFQSINTQIAGDNKSYFLNFKFSSLIWVFHMKKTLSHCSVNMIRFKKIVVADVVLIVFFFFVFVLTTLNYVRYLKWNASHHQSIQKARAENNVDLKFSNTWHAHAHSKWFSLCILMSSLPIMIFIGYKIQFITIR